MKNETKYSLFENSVNKNYINNHHWFLYFFDKTKDKLNNNENYEDDENDDGIIVLGKDPVVFYVDKYNKENITSCQGINKDYDYKNSWSLIFQEVKQKTLKPDNKDVIIGNDIQGVINFNYKTIVGNNHYLEIIVKTFFLTYITENICEKK